MELDIGIQVFIILLVSGLLLVGAEVFVPGGVLGALGGLALIGAAASAFAAFGTVVGTYVAISIVVLVGVSIVVWIKVFPRTKIGKTMTVSRDLSASTAAEPGLDELFGQQGEALSDLRPAGFARIGGKRVDVVTQGVMIDKGERVRVVEIEANRVVVKRTEQPVDDGQAKG